MWEGEFGGGIKKKEEKSLSLLLKIKSLLKSYAVIKMDSKDFTFSASVYKEKVKRKEFFFLGGVGGED